MNIFDYFQIVSLAVFLAIFFGRTYKLRRQGTEVVHMGSGKKGFPAVLEKSFIIFFPLWLYAIAETFLHLNVRLLPEILSKPLFINLLIQAAGVVIISFSILLFAGALVSFKTSWRVGIDKLNPGSLITGGVFSLSRNPIFLSMELYFLGTFLVSSNLFFLLSFIVMVLGVHFQIRQEEMFLLQKYGTNYQSYMSHVRRYL